MFHWKVNAVKIVLPDKVRQKSGYEVSFLVLLGVILENIVKLEDKETLIYRVVGSGPTNTTGLIIHWSKARVLPGPPN